ncbi:GNAT family N-acetyltransferase, partial [Candidatus Gottesmanbacteria bacterium]|nr:GNAT family N-acetyltransferase [Candidatus Gottesmanbacteria bacterium]
RNLDASQFIVACDGKKTAGCIRTVQIELDCRELASLVVLPDHRKEGIGTELIRRLFIRDRTRPIHLICYREKIPFYEKHHFQRINSIDAPVTLRRDYKRMTEKGLNLAIMVLTK